MKLTIFGLTVSSSWGNGHATLWRGLIRALAAAGHHVTFVERDVPWYAETRDLHDLPGGRLLLYRDWDEVLGQRRDLLDADAVIVTSYCPDAIAATRLIEQEATGRRVFYDLDTPVTLAALAAGESVAYLPPEGLGGFDLVLSYTGGPALDALDGAARRAAGGAALWPCRPRRAPAGAAAGRVPRRPVLSRHLGGGSPAIGRRAVPGAGPPPRRGGGSCWAARATLPTSRGATTYISWGTSHRVTTPPSSARRG